MNENKVSSMRRAVGLTVAAGAVVASAALAVPAANAATSHQSTASVLKNVTQGADGALRADNPCTSNGICNCPKPKVA